MEGILDAKTTIMPKFAKIFSVRDEHQVLVTLRNDEDMPLIVQETYYQDMYLTIKLGFDDDDISEEKFKHYSQEDASAFFEKAVSILDGEPFYQQQDDEPESNPDLN